MHTKLLIPALAFLALCSCATPQQTTARHSPSGTSMPASTPHQSEMVVTYDANGVPSFSFKRSPGDEQPWDETVRYNADGSATVHRNSAFAQASGMTDEEVNRVMTSPQYQQRLKQITQGQGNIQYNPETLPEGTQ